MKSEIILFARLALGVHLCVLSAAGEEVYFNDFNGSIGSKYSEWTSSAIHYASTGNPPGKGNLEPPRITNVECPNHAQRFLGEFGGPQIGVPAAPGYNRTRVKQTVSLSLRDLPKHTMLKVSFDLYILKSWDGLSQAYGPDWWSLAVTGGRELFTASFSNNPKMKTEGSYQDYPKPSSLPRSGSVLTNTMGFGNYFGDSTYHLDITFAHSEPILTLNFSSSLFEGKGTSDESWGLDNVKITTIHPKPDE
jgi:hypothetical protein